MIIPLLAFALVGQAVPPPEPARAELCSAQIEAFIAETAQASGRVAGPSWFIRDWWAARRPEDGAPGALTDEQRAALIAALPDRQAAEPDGFQAERAACIQEAMDGGAVPGMGPA